MTVNKGDLLMKTMTKFFFSRKILFAMTVLLTSLFLSSPCSCIENWARGKIVDKETGLPIEGVVIVRSWNRVDATPAGAVTTPLGLDETSTNTDGAFSFSIRILPHISIPFFSRIEENKLIAYKPGYKFIAFDKKTKLVEMEKARTYYERYEELQKAESNYERDYYTTNLLQEVLKIDENLVHDLPRSAKGIFSFVSYASDIDFDKDNHIYVATYKKIFTISNEGEYLDDELITESNKPIDIEADEYGDILVFMKDEFLKINNSEKAVQEAELRLGSHVKYVPFTTDLFNEKEKKKNIPANVDVRAALGLNIFLIPQHGNSVFSYDLDSHLRCSYTTPENDLKFTDITTGPDNSLFVNFFSGPAWNNNRYGYQTGVLRLDQDCRVISNKKIDLEGREARGIAVTADGNVIIATSNGFFTFDGSDYHLLDKKTINNDLGLGQVDIQRIKLDRNRENLYLIDSKYYGRILRYNTKTKLWDNGVHEQAQNRAKLNEKLNVRRRKSNEAESRVPGLMPLQQNPVNKQATSQAERQLMLRKDFLETGEKSIAPLLTAMKAKEEVTRLAAAWALGEVRNQKAVQALIPGLNDDNNSVRQLSAEALGKIQALEAVKPLHSVLLNKNEHIYLRTAAARALGEIKSMESVTVLISVLKEEFPPLSKTNDVNAYLKSTVIEALGKLGSPESVDLVVQALNDDNLTVRKSAAWALGEMKDKRAVRPLSDALNSSANADSQLEAKRESGIFPPRGKSGVREAIIEALVKCNDPNAVLPLTLALRDNNYFVRRSAAQALGKLKDQRAVNFLIASLSDEDTGVRKNSAEALALIGKHSVEPLIGMLDNNDEWSRRSAAYALGEINDERAVMPLIHSLKEQSVLVRVEAAVALGKIKDARAVQALITALKDKNPGVQKKASDALRNTGKVAVDSLINALHEKDLQLRINVMDTLAEIGRPAAGLLIITLKDKDIVIRWIAAWLLEKIGDEAIEDFLDALNNPDPEIRWRVAEVLGNMRSSRAIEGLISSLKDEQSLVRWKSAEALGKLKDSKALNGLSMLTKDSDGMVRKSATWSVSEIQKGSSQ